MKIITDSDISGAIAKGLREREGLGQRKFWASVGVSQPSGFNYESGRRIPKPVRSLLFLNYVAGLHFDTGTVEGARAARKLAALR